MAVAVERGGKQVAARAVSGIFFYGGFSVAAISCGCVKKEGGVVFLLLACDG